MENIVPIADDWFESIDNLDQPEISSASTIFTIRWLESAAWLLIVFRHWLVFVLTLIAFPIAMLLFTFILNIIFSVHPLTKLILFVVQIFGCLGLTHLILDYLNYISEGNLIKKRKKTLYFLSHVQNSLFYLICTTLLLLLFIFFMKPDLMGTNLFQNFITAAIVLFMIGQIFWILSILILKHAYSNYRGKSFLEKMEHLIDQQNVLKALLYGTSIKVYTVSNALHKPVDESQANTLYGLVKQKFTNNNASAIRKIDLQRLMNRSEVAEVLKFFPPAEFINLASLKSWMGKVCEERKTLLGLFNDTITAIEDIKPILFFFKGVLFIFAGCYVLGFATPKVLAVIAMPLLVLFLAFYRNLPDGIIFVFKMHWFDIGDCCILADQKLVVKDIGIFTTYFYDENNKIVSISISDLFTKSITNLTRSPMMSETLDVCVSKGTSADIKKLESGIDKFLRSKPESWSPGYRLSLKEVTIEGPKYALKVTHSTKFENFELNALQLSDLLDELMTILKDHLISAS